MGALAVAPLFEGTEETTGPGSSSWTAPRTGPPTRWNPCDPIHYVVNATLAPPGRSRTCTRRSAGSRRPRGSRSSTKGPPTRRRRSTDAYQPRPIRGSVGAGPHRLGGSGRLGHPVRARGPRGGRRRGAGHPAHTPRGPLRERMGRHQRGRPEPTRFQLPGEQGPVILHELGHLMGLGHVRTRGELMHPSGGGVVDFGPGDLEGLRQLGAEGGCIQVMEPIGAVTRTDARQGLCGSAGDAPCRDGMGRLGCCNCKWCCTREAGTVGAMIPDRICCPA